MTTPTEVQIRRSKATRTERLENKVKKEVDYLKGLGFHKLESYFWNGMNREFLLDGGDLIAVSVTDVTGIKSTLTLEGILVEGKASYSYPERGEISLNELLPVTTGKGGAQELLESLNKLRSN